MSALAEGAPYKVALFLARDPAIEASDFSGRWLSAVPPRSWPKGLLQHVHNAAALAAVPIENAPPAPFDAVDEFVFDSSDAAATWLGSDVFASDWLGPRTALLAGPVKAVSGPAVQVWAQAHGRSAEAVKILTLPVRRQGMAMAAFAEHWIVTHAGLALAGPGTRDRLLRLVSTPADGRIFSAFEAAPFDGIGIIEFDSPASLDAEFAGDHYRKVMAPDEPRFTDPASSRAMMVRETIVYSAA